MPEYKKVSLYFRLDDPHHKAILEKLDDVVPNRKMTEFFVELLDEKLFQNKEPLRQKQYKKLEDAICAAVSNTINKKLEKEERSHASEPDSNLVSEQMDALDIFGDTSYEDDEEEGIDEPSI